MTAQDVKSNLKVFNNLEAKEKLDTIREAIIRKTYNELTNSEQALVIEKAISSGLYDKLKPGEKLDVLEETIKPKIYNKLSAKQQTSAIQKVAQLISDVTVFLEGDKLPFYEKIILFVGKTGVGKSLLINFLAGKKIEVVINDRGEPVLNVIDPLPGINISHTITSCTTLPKAHISGEDIHVDTPGIEDSRGILHRIVNALLIQEVISHSQYVKFVLTIEEDYLTETGLSRLKSSINGLETHAKDLSKFKEGISVVITKGTTKQNNMEPATWAIARIDHILSEDYELSEYQREFLKFISEEKKIQYSFKKPIRETTEIVSEEKEHIKSAIKKLKFANKSENIHMKLLDEDRTKIMNVVEQVSKDVKELIEDFGLTVRNYSAKQMSQIEENSNRQQLHKLKADLSGLAGAIEGFYNLDNRAFNVKDFANKAKAQIEKIKTLEVKELDDILRQEKLLSIFADLVPNTSKDIFSDGLSCLKQLLDSLHTNISLKNDELTVTGGFPSLSEVMEKVNDQDIHHVKTIKINSDNTILLDADIKSESTHLLLVAQKCIAVGNTNITLDGAPGADKPDIATDGCPAADGKPGKPGGNGGHFVAVCGELYNGNYISISSNGGRGGDGQDGANGSNGVVPPVPSPSNCVEGPRSGGRCTKHYKNTCAKEVSGVSGCNGGKGGAEGYGGFAGTVQIINTSGNNKEEIALKNKNIKMEDGNKGEHGKGGNTGGCGSGWKLIWTQSCTRYSSNFFCPRRGGVDCGPIVETSRQRIGCTTNGISPTEKNSIGLIKPVENINPFDEATLQSIISNAKTSFETHNKALAQCKTKYNKPRDVEPGKLAPGTKTEESKKCKNEINNFVPSKGSKGKINMEPYGNFEKCQLQFKTVKNGEQTPDGLPLSAIIDISDEGHGDYIVCFPGFDVDKFFDRRTYNGTDKAMDLIVGTIPCHDEL
jgi:ribosome biogenesis GTPase A